MKKLSALLVAVAAVAALAVPALAATKTVKIGDNYFVRKGAHDPTVTIHSGDAVKFVWRGHGRHQVYQFSGPIDGTHFHTPTRTSGSYTRVFHKRGTYHLFCTVHPQTMKMTLKVK